MRKFLVDVGRIILGVAVVAAVLLLFSPVGNLMCGPSKCMEGELYGQGHWAVSGFVGAFTSAILIILVGVAWMIGLWVEVRAVDTKHQIDNWYFNRRLEDHKHKSLEDNGDAS